MPKRSRAVSKTIPPPVLGWNTRDAVSDMDPRYAVEIENFFPNFGTLDLRSGTTRYSTGVGTGIVRSLADLSGVGMVAIADSNRKAYSASLGAASDISGGVAFASALCSMFQFRDRLFIKERSSTTNDVYHWTGTGNIAASAFVGPGGDDKDLAAIGSYRSRIYFGQISASQIWYGGVDAVTGALASFDIRSYLKNSWAQFAILFVGSTSASKEASGEELFCVITTTGEVLLYSGDNPGSPTWNLVGRYQIPTPVGVNAFFYVGSGLCVQTVNGLLRINDLLRGTSAAIWPMMSDIIGNKITEIYGISIPYNQWNCGVNYPGGNYLLLNYSTDGATPSNQLVMNTSTGAWTMFSGMTAYNWVVSAGSLYFGSTDGVVMKADDGDADHSPATNAVVSRNMSVRPAYNYFDNREEKKQFVEAIPIVYQSEGLSLAMKADVDFENVAATGPITETGDTSYKLYRPTVITNGVGYCASMRIDGTVTTKRMSLQATQVIYNEGDIV